MSAAVQSSRAFANKTVLERHGLRVFRQDIISIPSIRKKKLTNHNRYNIGLI